MVPFPEMGLPGGRVPLKGKGKNIINNEKVAIKVFDTEKIKKKYKRENINIISEEEINKKKCCLKMKLLI